tara:strand:- start:5355 stop:6278 length:924 start_codon:yes stop_codon:yes gene_type:complete
MAFTERTLLIEADFLNGSFSGQQPWKLEQGYRWPKRFKVDADLITKFFETQVDEFWHTDKDQLELFQYFNDGKYFCQRRKQVYDFQTETYYQQTYSFTSGTAAQAEELYKSVQDFFYVVEQVKSLQVEEKVQGLDDEVIFWEQRWRKLLRQRNNMLGLSDWRVLPDIAEKYTGEKADWVKWRQWLRDNTLPSPTDAQFEGSGLKYFKYTYELKFPIDPSNYRRLYEGEASPPAFMDENDADQWVRQDGEASIDFFKSREENMYRLAQRGKLANRKVTESVLQLMRDLNVEDIVPLDWDKFYTDDSQL